MENGMGGKGFSNPFRVGPKSDEGTQNVFGEYNPQIEPAQPGEDAIISTEETRNENYMAGFEADISAQKKAQSRKRLLIIAAVVLMVLAFAAAGLLIMKNQSGNTSVKEEKERLEQEVAMLLQLTVNGKYNNTDEIDLDEVDEENLYIHKMMDAKEKNEKAKEKFFAALKKSVKTIKTQMKNSGERVGIRNYLFYRDYLPQAESYMGIFRAYSVVDYTDLEYFIEAFAQNGKAGLEEVFMSTGFKETSDARDRLLDTDEGEKIVNYIENQDYKNLDNIITENGDEKLTLVYYINLDYLDKLNTMMTLYSNAGCFQESTIDETCKQRVIYTEEGNKNNAEFVETVQNVGVFMNNWSRSFVREIENLRKELIEVE